MEPVPQGLKAEEKQGERPREGAAERQSASDDDQGGRGTRKRVKRRSKKTRRRSENLVPLYTVCVLSVLVMLLVIWMRSRMADAESDGPGQADRARLQQKVDLHEARSFVQEHLRECVGCISGFIEVGFGRSRGASPDGTVSDAIALRGNYVRDSERLAPVMERYYSENPPWRPRWAKEGTIREGEFDPGVAIQRFRGVPTRYNLVSSERGWRAIEAVWEDAEAGWEREVVFVEDDENRWRIDWEAFTRYSSRSWVEFLACEGPEEGVFRTYVRVGDPKPGDKVYRLVFHPWRERAAEGFRHRSPSVLVDRESSSGKRIGRILSASRDLWEVGDSILSANDPPGCHRVRVRLAWESAPEEGRRLSLVEVQAGNWLGRGLEDFPPGEEGEDSASTEPLVAVKEGASRSPHESGTH